MGLLSVALIALSIVALAPPLESSDSGPDPTGSVSATRLYVEGVLGRAMNASPFGARSAADRALVALLFRGLVRLGPGSSVTGDLASRWDVDATGKAWTFRLRDGLYWEDGQPITAEDVAFTVGVLSDPAYTGPGGESWRDVTATVIDAKTIQLRLSTALGGFLQAATQPIAPAHLLASIPVEQLADDPFGTDPVGSGPYRLNFLIAPKAELSAVTPAGPRPNDGGGPDFSARPTDSLASAAATAKPDFAVPYLSTIEFRYYDELDALRADWDSGALDAVSGLQPADAVALSKTRGARLVRYPGTTLLAAGLNLRAGESEFTDPAVRKALLQAVDRNGLVSTTLDGLGVRADSLIPPSSPMFDASGAPMTFDRTAARAALAAAGWKATDTGWIPKGSKEPLVIELLSPEETANPVAYAAAKAVADGWKAIGMAVRQVPLPAVQLIGDRLVRGQFQVAVLPFAIGLDPDLYPLLAASQTRTGGSNVIGLQDPDLDKLLVAARTPVAEELRIGAYKALQARLRERTYLLPLAFRDEYVVLGGGVTGPESRAVGTSGDRYWDVLTWRLADGR